MPKKLTDQEVASRMVELRNLRKLHVRDRAQIKELKAENKQLKELVTELRKQNDTQAIQIAELQTMVFGKKRKPPTGTPTPDDISKPEPKPRNAASYRRPIPPATAITSEVTLSLPEACHCGGSFAADKTTVHERYEQDIPLPDLTQNYQALLTTKQYVERGICLACGKATAGVHPVLDSPKNLGGQTVTLGPNTKLLVCHLISVVGMSYAQTSSLILALYNLSASEGEIAAIMQKKQVEWTPVYQQLQANIRAAPSIHLDETPWPIQALDGQGYGWVLAPSDSPLVCFALENSRGAPHARSLLQDYSGIRVTDDYGAYRNPTLPGSQQLCWAHLYRTVRDLRYNANLPEEQQPYVAEWYGGLASIYQDLRTYLEQPFDETVRIAQADELWIRIKTLASQPVPKAGEPDKLRRLKAQLIRAGKDRLFICLPKDTPCDNNRAERDIRPLVIKRKRSFGSRTEQGAKALATVMSLCTTAWRTQPNDYFRSLAALG